MEIEGAFYESLIDDVVRCHLCPADCRLVEGRRGLCRNRFNRDGKLYTDNYGEVVTLALDPIEKKPLYHFYPGSTILSTGPNGCNLSCKNCQNWAISQQTSATRYVAPDKLVALGGEQGSVGIAFTYTEPLIWYEYLLDVLPLMQESGLKAVLVSNGYIYPEPLQKLLPWIDAANIDLKSISPRFYSRVCKGRLQPILDTMRILFDAGVHLEITNLLIPGLNDSEEDILGLTKFVASLDKSVPLHLSAYHPDNKMDAPATSADTMTRAREIAVSRLQHVFVGNMHLEGASDTHCAACGSLLIERSGFGVAMVGIEAGKCRACDAQTEVVM
jgi:pyruvate formate lyase activating enzyme